MITNLQKKHEWVMKASWWKFDEEQQDIDTKYLLITEIKKKIY